MSSLVRAIVVACAVAVSAAGPVASADDLRSAAASRPTDILIAIDTTGSMEDAIAQAVADARELVGGVRREYPGTQFAVAQFRDSRDDVEYRLMQPLVADAARIERALSELSAEGGHDDAEAYNLVFQKALDREVGWRAKSRRLLVVIGDAEPHGAASDFSSCRDTSDDPHGLDTSEMLAGLRAHKVSLLMVFHDSENASTRVDCYQQLAEAAYPGGSAREGGDDLVGAIRTLVDEAILEYVALGDSYSSGEGNPKFESVARACHRSTTSAWPTLLMGIAQMLTLKANLACSGATTNALHAKFQGQDAQLAKLQELSPDVVTITIGGNDVKFGPAVRECLLRDCRGMLAEVEKGDFPALVRRLPGDYDAIKDAAPEADVYVVGYPRLFPERQADTTKCGWLEPHERETLNRLGAKLNGIMKRTAQAQGFVFVSVEDALDNHELCSKDSWVFKVAHTCVRDSKCGHPLKRGQLAIAKIVASAIQPVPRAAAGTGRALQRHALPAARSKSPEHASQGNVKATLRYAQPTEYTFADLRVEISRGGDVRVSEFVPSYPGTEYAPQPAGYGVKRSLFVRDLDGDREPEVLLNLHWGGAHCCTWSRVYRWNRQAKRYTSTLQMWGNIPYRRLVDLDGDRRVEFIGADDAFSSSNLVSTYADALSPVKVWQFQHGKFRNVTRRFPKLVQQDLARHARVFRQEGANDLRPAAAAWAADMALLGRAAQAKRQLDAWARSGVFSFRNGDETGLGGSGPKNQAFVNALWRFLRKHQYL